MKIDPQANSANSQRLLPSNRSTSLEPPQSAKEVGTDSLGPTVCGHDQVEIRRNKETTKATNPKSSKPSRDKHLPGLRHQGTKAATGAALGALPSPAGLTCLTFPDGTIHDYPKAPTSDASDSYAGIQVADPYRSLEQQTSDSTRAWVSKETQFTREFLQQLPGRQNIEKAVCNAVHGEIRSLPVVGQRELFYLKTEGFGQGVLCRSDLDGKNERPLFDPNTLSNEGLFAVHDFIPSPDGKKLAYALVENGTDWYEWRVRDLQTNQDEPGNVRSSKFGMGFEWKADSKGFYYTQFDRPAGDLELVEADKIKGSYYHKLGTSETKDRPSIPPNGGETQDLSKLLPASQDELQKAVQVKNEIYAHYLKDGHSRLERFDSQGKSLGEVPLPQIGAIYDLRASEDRLFFDFSGPAYPPSVFQITPGADKAEIFWQAKANYNPQDYETTLEFSTSSDGTRIPLYITRHKNTELTGQNPTFLYGYGGFACAEFPDNKSNLNIIPWLDMGGVFVDCGLRGGSEYGEAWHQGGMKLNKQNVFDDFESAGDYLMKRQITGPGKLAAGGRSNGGLLAAATELQRPDLFSAVVPEVGVMDLMRFPKFTCGNFWVSEYGSPDKKSDVKNMLKYSPLQNVTAGKAYPATLFMTADHDDRVPPGAHTYKQVATLQQGQGADKPVLMRVEEKAGHGSYTHPWPTPKLIGQDTDRWTFLAHALHMQPTT